MSKVYEVKIQEDTRAYSFDVEGIRGEKEQSEESATYIEVLSFLKDMFKLVDFSHILKNSKRNIL